jgi:hypothetical protein
MMGYEITHISKLAAQVIAKSTKVASASGFE